MMLSELKELREKWELRKKSLQDRAIKCRAMGYDQSSNELLECMKEIGVCVADLTALIEKLEAENG